MNFLNAKLHLKQNIYFKAEKIGKVLFEVF